LSSIAAESEYLARQTIVQLASIHAAVIIFPISGNCRLMNTLQRQISMVERQKERIKQPGVLIIAIKLETDELSL